MKRIDYLYRASLVRCVDGDTVDLNVDLGFCVYTRIRFRLYGIDTPERGQENYKEATQFLELLLKQGDIRVRSTKTGKYGRWLGELFVDTWHPPKKTINVNSEMIAAGLAKEYL